MMQNAFSIAIDGPVGAGKGVVARELAKKLGGFHFNTGAMYRCLALYCLQQGIDFKDEDKVYLALKDISISPEENRVLLNDIDVTTDLASQEVAQGASDVGTIVAVRQEMVKRQRAIVLGRLEKGQIVIIDARDAATDIVPDAKVKIFLTASPEVRAKRRFDQLGGIGNLSQIIEEIKKRDYQDTHREASPLALYPQEHGYLVVDNSGLSEHDTIALILSKIQENI
jgi:cytidylate kinase